MKIITLIPCWMRPEIVKLCAENQKFLQSTAPDGIELETFYIISPEDPYYNQLIKICEPNILIYDNFLSSRKLNAGIRWLCNNLEFDYLMNCGSDNIFSLDFWSIYEKIVLSNTPFFGFTDMVFVNYDSLEVRKFTNYATMHGVGRCISSAIIKKIVAKGDIYPETTHGLDTASLKIIEKHTNYITFNNLIAIDIKTAVNIWPWLAITLMQNCGPEEKINPYFERFPVLKQLYEAKNANKPIEKTYNISGIDPHIANMITTEGFINKFNAIRNYYSTDTKAYDACEVIFFAAFGQSRYSDFESFRQTRYRFNTKTLNSPDKN